MNVSSTLYEQSYFGHNDLTELYSRSENSFLTPPPNNYTATVIGPDGSSFANTSAAISMCAYGKFQPVSDACRISKSKETFNALPWISVNSTISNTSAFDNATFAAPIVEHFLTRLPPGVIRNANIHTPFPRPYHGGANNPTLKTVLKFWLCDDNQAVSAFRRAQLSLEKSTGINFSESFVLFTTKVPMYDRSTATPWASERMTEAIVADQWRGDTSFPPSDSI